MKHTAIPILLAITACDYDAPCLDDYVDTTCPEDTEPCSAETGSAECNVFVEPEIDETWISCDGVESEIEVLTESAVHTYGVTDYAFESSLSTLAGLLDFVSLEILNNEVMMALPGVVTHDDGAFVGLFSRVCCAQHVVEGMLMTWPESPTCASAGHALPAHPGAWCADVLDGSHAGLCVYPCDTDNDCPVPSGEFCDLTSPDPSGRGAGVCRYRSMPIVPTPEDQIGN